MKILRFLFFSVFLAATPLYAQVDSFLIGSSKFKVRAPEGWSVAFLKDSAAPESGQSNAVFRFPAYSECVYSVIDVHVVKRTHKPAEPKSTTQKKKKKKKSKTENAQQETFAEFRDVQGYECFYYSVEEPNKKCSNTKFNAGYLHRINDSLDVVISLSGALSQEESWGMEEKLRVVADSFFSENDAVLKTMKGHLTAVSPVDSMFFLKQAFYFPVPAGWKVDKRFEEEPDDPTGRRIQMVPVITNGKNLPPCITITVDEFSYSAEQAATYIMIKKGREAKKTERNPFVFVDSISRRAVDNGMDTLVGQRGDSKNWQGEQVNTFVQYYTFIVPTEKGIYSIEFSLANGYYDPLEIQYCYEQFKVLCEYVLTNNNFRKWNPEK